MFLCYTRNYNACLKQDRLSGNNYTPSRNGLVINYRYFIDIYIYFFSPILYFSCDDWQDFEVAVTVFPRDDSSAIFVLNLIFEVIF
jgi:hypothetical protein